MLKKPGLEELVRELERDYARWEQVYMAGSKDPFWPDGVNANLCRNHILCGKKRIRALDLYEGYPHLYRKENLSVTMDGGERDIMAYVMTGEREYGVPARSYYETIARGYADAGFDIGVLNEAVQESVRRMLDEMEPEEELNETWQMTL